MGIEVIIEEFCRGCENNKPDGSCQVRISDGKRLEMAMAYESALGKIKDEPARKFDFCCRRSIADPEEVLFNLGASLIVNDPVNQRRLFGKE